jgi:hypothetical protein
VKVTIALLVALFTLLLASSAYADPVGVPCRRGVHLTQGQAAPCEGDLLPTSEVIRLLDAEDALESANRSIADAEARLKAAELSAADESARLNSLLQIERKARRECETAQVPPQPVPEGPRWYVSPWLWGTVGVVLGSAATIAVVKAVR